MFYEKKKSSNLVTIFNYVIGTVYIYSWKKIDKILTHFGGATYQKKIFFGRTWCSTWQWSDLPGFKHRYFLENSLEKIEFFFV